MPQMKLFGEASFESNGGVNFPENIELVINSAIDYLKSGQNEAELLCCQKLKQIIEEYKQSIANKSLPQTTVAKKSNPGPAKTSIHQTITMPTQTSVPDIHSDTKIGILVRSTLSYLIAQNLIDEEAIRNLTSEHWCREKFHINHSLLCEIKDNIPIKEQGKDSHGRKRYWDYVFEINSKRYLACKEWFERQRKYYVSWYEKFLNDAKSESIYKKNKPVGLRNLF